MAASVCSDSRTVEDLTMMRSNPTLDVTFYPYQPPPAAVSFTLLDSSSSSLDITHHLPSLDHLAFHGDSTMTDDAFDVDLFSYLFPSSHAPSAACDQLDLYTTPWDLVSSDTLFCSGALTCGPAAAANAMAGTTDYLEPEPAFSSPLEKMEALQQQRPGNGEKAMAPSGCGGGGLSAHSMAARQRRRRISEKTLELGQLIPGCSRMNTAEMLQAAFKYVRFLQAQVGMLDVVRSFLQDEQLQGWSPREASRLQLMQVLLASPAVQEKLSAEGRCVVPTWVVHELAEDHGIKGHSSISRDLSLLIKSMG